MSILSESESAKYLHNAKVKKIGENFNKLKDTFLKPKIKEIRENFYEIENKKNLFASKLKEIEKNLFELGESVSKLKKYYDYDDAEYMRIRYVKHLFNQSTDEDYYSPIKNKSAFNGNYIEYENNGDKDKNLSATKCLNRSDMS